jgi:tetratricopeptide (TPR) repeat protein
MTKPVTREDQAAAAWAQALHQAGSHAEAAALLLPIAHRHIANAELQMLTGMAARAAGLRAEALAAFQRAADARPGDPQIANILANTMAGAGASPDERQAALTLFDRLVAQFPDFVDAHINRALTWQEAGDAPRALGAVEQSLLRHPANARLLALRGVFLKNLGRTDEALVEFDSALAIEPGRALTHFNRGVALRALERNAEAVQALDEARKLGLNGAKIDAAQAAALLESGDIDRAEVLYQQAFAGGEAEAGVALARLRLEYRDDADPFAHYAEQARVQPLDGAVWHRWLGCLLDYRAYPALAQVASQAVRFHPGDRSIRALAGYAEALTGDLGRGIDTLETLCAEAPGNAELHLTLAELRLRQGEPGAAEHHAVAATTIDPPNQAGWAWLGTVWRLTGDPREAWLCDYERLVMVTEVGEDAAAYAAGVAAALEPYHVTRRAPGNQSLRAGTQTSGSLFARPDPVLRALSADLMKAVEAAVAQLPIVGDHPFLARARDGLRFAGSWSVRLSGDGGHHVPHFHGAGWLSSAYYAALPEAMTQAPPASTAGHIQFGSPPAELGLNLAPRRIVRPEPGRLVLFPSYLWHGTLPFPGDGTRLTAAFDIVPAKA